MIRRLLDRLVPARVVAAHLERFWVAIQPVASPGDVDEPVEFWPVDERVGLQERVDGLVAACDVLMAEIDLYLWDAQMGGAE